MTEEEHAEIKTQCWCYARKKQVVIHGLPRGKRQADLIEVTDCNEKNCILRGDLICLIGKIREGRWE